MPVRHVERDLGRDGLWDGQCIAELEIVGGGRAGVRLAIGEGQSWVVGCRTRRGGGGRASLLQVSAGPSVRTSTRQAHMKNVAVWLNAVIHTSTSSTVKMQSVHARVITLT